MVRRGGRGNERERERRRRSQRQRRRRGQRRRRRRREAIGNGAAQRLGRLLERRGSQPRDSAGTAELEPRASGGAPRGAVGRRHGFRGGTEISVNLAVSLIKSLPLQTKNKQKKAGSSFTLTEYLFVSLLFFFFSLHLKL